ncbi:MAG TPA: PLP-dependent aminotransferase family protein [Burkholderiaceae bacterium]|nr:PLP-dependent aminotransferase family protein [Burkholderiaceae bacterium]
MELLLSVNRNERRPIQVQLYEGVRALILNAGLKPGQRLPSSRLLAHDLALSRNTVTLSYERLAAEGYVTTRPKAGTYVNREIPDAGVLVRRRHPAVAQGGPERTRLGRNPPFSGRAQELWPGGRRPQFDLFVGRPSMSGFPARFWRRSAARHLSHPQRSLTEYGDPRGLLALRQGIAQHLRATRGIVASPEQVLITAGIQGALNIIARIFLAGRSASAVAIENPCYQGAAFLFASYGARLFPIDVDQRGLQVEQLARFAGSLVYVTPSHQFPTGCTMALERRLHLLDWAYRTGSYLVEDDYDSDFRYDGPPLTALAGLDRRGRVIYLGTFSKSIGAGMRLGYIVWPEHLLEQARIVKALLDNGNPWLEQAVVADFLREGEFLRHLRRIRSLYVAARDALLESLHAAFGEIDISGAEGGMHVMWRLPPPLPDARAMQAIALSCDVGLYPLAAAAGHEFEGRRRFGERSLVLGYTALTPTQLREAIMRVAAGVRHASTVALH